MKTEKQYFIAIIPPQPYFDEAFKLKYHFRDQYNSKGSLHSPPHITLHMPFKWKEEKENELTESLANFSKALRPFQIQFNNFGCFSPRVIFIDVVRSDALQEMQGEMQRFCRRELNLFNTNYKEHPYNPHLTVAFRDLKKPAFVKAWQEFSVKTFEGVFEVNRIALLKHNGKMWEIFNEFSLSEVTAK